MDPILPGNTLHLFPMTEVPAGTYMMGGIEKDKFVTAVELPRHHVTLSHPFALGTTPVTCKDWKRIMGTTPRVSAPSKDELCPVVNVTFPEVMTFLRKLSILLEHEVRLPSEAEWEFACRAGSSSVFPKGDRLEVSDANFLYDHHGSLVGIGAPTPVGSYRPNAFGIADLTGNVCEWTADQWHPNFHGAPCDGSPWLTGGKQGYRTIRGGAWDHLPHVLRASWRDWAPENARWDNLGFRIARSL